MNLNDVFLSVDNCFSPGSTGEVNDQYVLSGNRLTQNQRKMDIQQQG